MICLSLWVGRTVGKYFLGFQEVKTWQGFAQCFSNNISCLKISKHSCQILFLLLWILMCFFPLSSGYFSRKSTKTVSGVNKRCILEFCLIFNKYILSYYISPTKLLAPWKNDYIIFCLCQPHGILCNDVWQWLVQWSDFICIHNIGTRENLLHTSLEFSVTEGWVSAWALEMGFVESLGSVSCRSNVAVLTVISAKYFKLLSPASSAEKPEWGPAAAAVIATSFLHFIG